MMGPMAKRPWTIPRYASLLADLHDQLHEIPAPDWLSESPDGGDRLVHLDLHPLNVLLSVRGPVVIDWANAARGNGLSDVAFTYVLLTCPQMPGPRALQIAARPARDGMARLFVRRYRGNSLAERIAFAADLKALDRNMTHDEIVNLHRLALEDAEESTTRPCAKLNRRRRHNCRSAVHDLASLGAMRTTDAKRAFEDYVASRGLDVDDLNGVEAIESLVRFFGEVRAGRRRVRGRLLELGNGRLRQRRWPIVQLPNLASVRDRRRIARGCRRSNLGLGRSVRLRAER